MIVICEECGKKYQIDPSRIKSGGTKARCKVCGNMMTIPKPEALPQEPPVASVSTQEIAATKKDAPPPPPKGKEEAKAALPKTKRAMGLRTKIFILFFLIPIILFVGAGYLYLWQLGTLSSLITQESSKAVTRLGEQIITEKARSVAEQTRLFLLGHPNLRKEEYDTNQEFRQLAVQKVGLTGYTAFYAVPDENKVWRTWAHDNPKIVGIDMSTLKGPMGRNFDGFWKVFSSAKDGKESKGYYTWQEKDGSFREKYMVCSPVKGTRYVVAATTYLDEFTRPVKEMEAKANQISTSTRNIVLGVFGGTLLLIGIVVALYGARLTGRIKKLTAVAEQISVGEMDTEIPATSKDEIGDLAEAIGRMQESIRLSIERLRRRR